MAKKFSEEFIREMQDLLGEEEAGQLVASLDTEAVTSIRLNAAKKFVSPDWFDDGLKVEWCGNGRYLSVRPQFTFEPQLHAGCFYVQDASSMIYEEIVARLSQGVHGPLRYFDMCAAPGGKTTSAINVLPQNSLVVANEFVGQRANILKENLQKWGSTDVIVTNSSADKFACLSGLFDIVAVDAPCSGEGMMRKDDEAVGQWTPQLVERCGLLQWDILSKVWNTLKCDGFLIYSTCTFNRLENEVIVDKICCELGGETVDMNFPSEWGIMSGIDTPHRCYRFMPHRTRGEGLFVAVIRKTSEQESLRLKFKKGDLPTVRTVASEWLNSSGDFEYLQIGDKVCAIRAEHLPVVSALSSHKIKSLQTGIELAVVKHKDVVPQHALSLSWQLKESAFVEADLDKSAAIAYLSRENIVLPADMPRGFVIVTYKGSALGFVKNLGNRCNNLYPQEWKIRTSLR